MLVALVFTPRISFLAGVIVLVAVTVVFHYLLRTAQRAAPGDLPPPPRRGLLGIVMGQDLRTSTSKFQMVMWTYAVAVVLLALLFLGRSWGCGTECQREFEGTLSLKGSATDLFESGLEAEYLILLGFPGLAGLIAKGLTASRASVGQILKPRAAEDRNLPEYLADIVSDDQGKGDLGDFQYFVFNTIALAYFFIGWTDAPANGLPSLPDTLVALTGTSAAVYVGKKAVDRATPTITSIAPPIASPGTPIEISVAGLFGPDQQAATAGVVFGSSASPGTYANGTVTVTVPDGLVPAGATSADVMVKVVGTGLVETNEAKLIVT